MKRFLMAMLAVSVASTALGQGHDMPGHTMPMPKEKPGPVAPAKARLKAAATPAPKPSTGPMDGHDMSTLPKRGTAEPAEHDMSVMVAMGQATTVPPVAPPPAAAFSGPEHAADAVYGAEESADAREQFRDEHGDILAYKVLIDQLEAQIHDGRDGYSWDGQGWYGRDINKLWVKSEGEGGFGESPEQAEIQALYSLAIDPWFNLQAGIRYDFRPDPERAHLVLGIQGLARMALT